MPPLPRPRLALTTRLIDALRALPAAEQLRALATVEELAVQIDPEASYPESWLRFRLLPPSLHGADAPSEITAGRHLLPDLDALAQTISGAPHEPGLPPPPAISGRELVARWKASAATIARLRSQGLIARRIRTPRGRASLTFTLAHVEAFERARPALVARPGGYDRLTPEQRRRILRHARRYRALLGLSLSAAAKRIAARTNRSHEGIRQLLLGHATELGFPDDSPLNARRRAAIDRAHRMGVEVGRLARLAKRSRSAVRRALAMAEAERLRSLLVPPANAQPHDAKEPKEAIGPLSPPHQGPEPGTDQRAEPRPDHRSDLRSDHRSDQRSDQRATARPDPLEAPPARSGLGSAPTTDLLELLQAVRRAPPPLAVEERARALAYHRLRALSREQIQRLDPLHPSPSAIDTITTRLRWAARLKAELLRAHLRLLIETVESRAPRPLAELPAAWVLAALPPALDAAARAIDLYEPHRGGRLAGPMALAVDRLAARWVRDHPAEARTERPRAAPILMPGAALPDWTRTLCPWQRWLEPDGRVAALARRSLPTARDAELISVRFGLGADDGAPPATLAQLGKRFAIAPTRISDTLDAALARSLTLARSG